MSRERTPFSNPELAEDARGFSRTSIRIAQNNKTFGHLNDFVQAYVTPEVTQYFDGQATHTYGYSPFSGLGVGGTLVHVRHRQAREETAPAPNRLTAVVIGSLCGAEPISIIDTQTQYRAQYDGSQHRAIVLDTAAAAPFEPSDRDMPDMTLRDRELEWWLDAEEMRETTPELTYAHGRWQYKRPDGLIEPMTDLLRVYSEVVLARQRLVGTGALQAVAPLTVVPTNPGHFDEKVVA